MASSSAPLQTSDPNPIFPNFVRLNAKLKLPPNFDPARHSYPPGLEPPKPYRIYRDWDFVGRALSADDDALMWQLFEKWLRDHKRYYRKSKSDKERRFKIFKDNLKEFYARMNASSWAGPHRFADLTLEERRRTWGGALEPPDDSLEPATRNPNSPLPPSAIASYPPGSEPPIPYQAYNELSVLQRALSANDDTLMWKLFEEWMVDAKKSYPTEKEKEQQFKTFKESAKKICEIPWVDQM